MKEQKIHVLLEVPIGEILDSITTTYDKNVLSKSLIDKVRIKAEAQAAEAGGWVRTDRVPTFQISRMTHAALGGDWLLVASEWWCEMPDSFELEHAR